MFPYYHKFDRKKNKVCLFQFFLKPLQSKFLYNGHLPNLNVLQIIYMKLDLPFLFFQKIQYLLRFHIVTNNILKLLSFHRQLQFSLKSNNMPKVQTPI